MRRRRRKNRRKISYIRVIALFVLLCGAALGGLAYWWLFTPLTPDEPDDGIGLYSPTAVNVMLLGVDHRADDVGRSDTIAILTVDMKHDHISLLSIPRDTRIAIPGNGYDKINHAYAFGGRDLSIKTLENFLGAKIHHYALFDVAAFVRIIDILGGVTINVERPMHYEDPWDDNGGLVIDFKPGSQHLDGQKTMEYVRYRDEEGDLGRIGRQQTFVRELIHQVSVADVLFKLPELLSAATAAVDTDLDLRQQCTLALYAAGMSRDKLHSAMIAGRPAYLDSISYWIPDIRLVRHQIAAAMLINETPEFIAASRDLAEEYRADMPRLIYVQTPAPPTDKTAKAAPDGKNKAKKPADAKKTPDPAKTETPDKSSDKDGDKDSGKTDAKAATKPTDKKDPATDKKDEAKTDGAKAEKTAAAPAPLRPADITVTIVNSSGINGAGARLAEHLTAKGFTVLEPTTGQNRLHETRAVVDDNAVDLFYGMPFPCLIMGGGDGGEAYINIGEDFTL